jgi:hypothetical protein
MASCRQAMGHDPDFGDAEGQASGGADQPDRGAKLAVNAPEGVFENNSCSEIRATDWIGEPLEWPHPVVETDNRL